MQDWFLVAFYQDPFKWSRKYDISKINKIKLRTDAVLHRHVRMLRT